MIQINLLPENDKKGRAPKKAGGMTLEAGPGQGGNVLVAVVALAVASVVGGAGYFSWNTVHQAQMATRKLEAEKKEVATQIAGLSDQAKEIQHLREVFNNQWEVLQSLDPPDRILWSEKVNMLAHFIPADVFVSKLKLDEEIVEVELQSSIEARQKWEEGGKKGTKPEVTKKPVINYTLRITGQATGADNVEQFDNVLKFHDAMKAYETVDNSGTKRSFMDCFNPDIEFENIQATLYEGFPVNQFTFKLRSKPVSPTEPTKEETDSKAAKEPAKKTPAKRETPAKKAAKKTAEAATGKPKA